MTEAELTLTEGADTAFRAVVDFFHAATAPGASTSFSLTLGEGGGFSFGSVFGGSAPASEGGAAPVADGGGAAAAPTPAVE
jgi:hypothetical protein